MELDEKIFRLRTEFHEKERYEKQLHDAKEEYGEIAAREMVLKEALIREEKDVKCLESLSFANFWFSLLGTKTEKLSQEKRESYQAEYEYKKNQNAKENLAQEIADLEAKLTHLQESVAEYDTLLAQKEDSILLTDSNLSQRIRDISNSLSCHQIATKEISEAISSGNDLLTRLYEVRKSLHYARSSHIGHHTGTQHSMIFFRTHLNNAQIGFADLKYYADRFRRELKDVNTVISSDQDFSSELCFTDALFDQMYIEITMHFEISASIQRLENLIFYIQSIISRLGDERRGKELAMSSLIDEKKQLLENAIECPNPR
jgi:hypothetical protein